eukprot:GEMP01067542.1.p1 GENE.GEMP01067542.1~~GEMP01067542.1.p1  ORF type:complete len:265 (+),score=51.18 GEMP01067542.1:30-797(+)
MDGFPRKRRVKKDLASGHGRPETDRAHQSEPASANLLQAVVSERPEKQEETEKEHEQANDKNEEENNDALEAVVGGEHAKNEEKSPLSQKQKVLANNKEMGRRWEDDVLSKRNKNAAHYKQVLIECRVGPATSNATVPAPIRIVADCIRVDRDTQRIHILELKATQRAPLSKGQRALQDLFQRHTPIFGEVRNVEKKALYSGHAPLKQGDVFEVASFKILRPHSYDKWVQKAAARKNRTDEDGDDDSDRAFYDFL